MSGRVKEYTLVGSAADDDAFVTGTDTTAGTALTLLAAAAAIDPPRELAFTTDADMTNVTVTIIGIDRWGNAITEELVLPDTDDKNSRKIYSKVISITPDTTNANNVKVGYPQRVVSPWVAIDLGIATEGSASGQVATEVIEGSPDFSVEITDENFMQVSGDGALVQSSTDTTPPAVTDVTCVAVRGVNTASSGTITMRVTRATPQ